MMQQDDDENVFKTFTDCLFTICIVLSLLVVILGINVNKKTTDNKIDEVTKQNEFSGGTKRPELNIAVHEIDYSVTKSTENDINRKIYDNIIVEYQISSPSYAEASLTVKDGETVSTNADESFSGTTRGGISEFLSLSSWIDIGEFNVNNKMTSLVVPKIHKIGLIIEDNPSKIVAPSSEVLAKKLLAWGWPVLSNKIYPVRNYNEYKYSKCKVYFESEVDKSGSKWIIIGNYKFPIPKSVTKGKFDFLTSLSSSLTQFVYLGEINTNVSEKTNTRIEILNQLGYTECAEYFRNFLFNRRSTLPSDYTKFVKKLPQWDDFNDSDKDKFKKEINENDNDKAKSKYENYIADSAIGNFVDYKLSICLLNNYKITDIPSGLLPPFVKYPEEREAYIRYRKSMATHPPEWVVNEFLIPLGYDKRVLKD